MVSNKMPVKDTDKKSLETTYEKFCITYVILILFQLYNNRKSQLNVVENFVRHLIFHEFFLVARRQFLD